MMDIGVGSIITKGLGGPACNLMIFGPFRLYIEPIVVTPTPTVTSGLTPTPTPTGLTPTPTVTSGLTPTPTVTSGLTPTPTPSSTYPVPSPSPSVPTTSPPISGGGGGGGGIVIPRDDDDDELPKYKLTFVVKFRKRSITRTFIVDSFKKDKIIKRVGRINTLRIKFKVAWDKVTNNRFITRWKK